MDVCIIFFPFRIKKMKILVYNTQKAAEFRRITVTLFERGRFVLGMRSRKEGERGKKNLGKELENL